VQPPAVFVQKVKGARILLASNACIRKGSGEKPHETKRIQGDRIDIHGLVLALGAARHAQAQDTKNLYPTSMVPLDQYLMGRDAEIALARSAAPRSVAKDATVMVLGRDGYETAVEGTNGFVCT
jgi:hypothetical protein